MSTAGPTPPRGPAHARAGGRVHHHRLLSRPRAAVVPDPLSLPSVDQAREAHIPRSGQQPALFDRFVPPELGTCSLPGQRPGKAARPAAARIESSCGVWTRAHSTSRRCRSSGLREHPHRRDQRGRRDAPTKRPQDQRRLREPGTGAAVAFVHHRGEQPPRHGWRRCCRRETTRCGRSARPARRASSRPAPDQASWPPARVPTISIISIVIVDIMLRARAS